MTTPRGRRISPVPGTPIRVPATNTGITPRPPPGPAPEFKDDRRKENPGLHLLYVKWAVLHLKAIDDCIRKLGDFSNLNLHDSMTALASERKKLVTDNAAYADADEILKAMACGTYHPADEAPE